MEVASNLISQNALKSSNSRSHSTFDIDTIGGDMFKMKESTSQGSLKSASLIEKRKIDISILGFQDHEKVEETPNSEFLLNITITITNHYV